jgi:hypothetical protein
MELVKEGDQKGPAVRGPETAFVKKH